MDIVWAERGGLAARPHTTHVMRQGTTAAVNPAEGAIVESIAQIPQGLFVGTTQKPRSVATSVHYRHPRLHIAHTELPLSTLHALKPGSGVGDSAVRLCLWPC